MVANQSLDLLVNQKVVYITSHHKSVALQSKSFALLLQSTQCYLSANICQLLANQSLDLLEWGFGNQFHRDRHEPQATACNQ